MAETWTITSGEDLGRAIADVRRAKDMGQDDLARLVGLSPSYVSKIESGRSVTLLEHMLRSLRRLGATVVVTYDGSGG